MGYQPATEINWIEYKYIKNFKAILFLFIRQQQQQHIY